MKRLQVVLSAEAWQAVEALCGEANQGFDGGNISSSDAINEMILCARVDVKGLQLKHTDLRRALRAMAGKKELDLDSVIRALTDLKGKVVKKRGQNTMDEEF
jgi:hypothetical protein